MLRGVLDVLFPPRCLGCGGTGHPFCGTCLPRVGRLSPPGCRRCGRPFEAEVTACPDCPPPPIAWARAALRYEGPVRSGLIRLKFYGWRSAAPAFAPWMLAALMGDLPPGRPPGPSVVTWVPLGRRRRRERGFDQAEVLARAVATEAGWPVRRLLDRAVETSPQAKRSGPQRREALRGAFRARGRPPPWVVLVDDVLTSGATGAECARVLLDAGAREVGLLCAARALGGPIPVRCYTPPGLGPGSVVAREMPSW
jgi:predicted amidophosphoribosyltransferase